LDSLKGIKPVILVYPGLYRKPVILASVECLLTGQRFLVPMLLDTGCDETCFPAKFAADFGHNNHHPHVIKTKVNGVGGESVCYMHSVCISLIDPDKSNHLRHVIAWESKIKKAAFIEKLDCDMGLLGMDIVNKWKSVKLVSSKKGPIITIEI
jgi:hypothetical protein